MELASLILLVAVLAIILIVLSTIFTLMLVGSALTRVPFVPISKSVLDELPKLLPLKAGDVFYDLGCGDGRVVTHMAKLFPMATCVGIEIAPLPYFLARLRVKFLDLKNVKILRQDIMMMPLGDAGAVFTYLGTTMMGALLPKFIRELRPGVHVVSADFEFKDKKPAHTSPVGRGTGKHTLRDYVF